MFHFTKLLNPNKDGLPIGNLDMVIVVMSLAYRIKLRPLFANYLGILWMPFHLNLFYQNKV